MFEGVAVAEGGVLHACAVVVDSVGGIAEQFGYLSAGVNAEANKGEDTQLGGHTLAGLGIDTLFGHQQGIEVGNEIAVEGEEGRTPPSHVS